MMAAAAVLLLAAPAAASFSYVPPPDPPVYQNAPEAPPGSLAALLADTVDDVTDIIWADGTDPARAAPSITTDWRAALTAADLAWRHEGSVLHVFPAGIAQGGAPADAEPAHEVWSVAAGELLADVLRRWGDEADVDIVWLTDRRWRIDQAAAFRGDFADATRALLFGLSHLSHAPVAQFAASGRTLAIVHRPPPAPEDVP